MRRSTGIVLAIGLLFGAFVFYSLMRVEPVEVLHSRLVRDGGQVYVAGEVRDSGDRAVGMVKLELHYFGQDGRALGQDTLDLGNLEPKQSKQFQGPARTLAGVQDYSIYINHERNPYGN